jgi:hypothetical protein
MFLTMVFLCVCRAWVFGIGQRFIHSTIITRTDRKVKGWV